MGFCFFTPIGSTLRRLLPCDSELLLSPHHPNSSHGKSSTELDDLRKRFTDASEPDSEELRRRREAQRIATKQCLDYGRDGAPLRERLRDIDRPHTLMADLAYELTPAVRAHVEAKIKAANGEDPTCGEYTKYLCRWIIPFGNLYYAETVSSAVRALAANGCPSCGGQNCSVDLIGINRDAVAAITRPWAELEALLRRHVHNCTACGSPL